MRERTIPVNKEILCNISDEYRPTVVAKRLGISKQRWYNYRTVHDMPESVLVRLCTEFGLDRSLVIRQ